MLKNNSLKLCLLEICTVRWKGRFKLALSHIILIHKCVNLSLASNFHSSR
uniref:Uncharacterized protein n=1 Tax=Rhizophora mucronata TaxID=61149 RepID=A0A2P2P2Q9_RHIMU